MSPIATVEFLPALINKSFGAEILYRKKDFSNEKISPITATNTKSGDNFSGI